MSAKEAWFEMLLRVHSFLFGAGIAVYFTDQRDLAAPLVLAALVIGFLHERLGEPA